MLLVIYGGVRLVLRVRGQFRYVRWARELPPLRSVRALPEHLTGEVTTVFESGETMSVALERAVRSLDEIVITDPDSALGSIRDKRYRRTVLEAWRDLQAWLAAWDATSEREQLRAVDLGVTPDELRDIAEQLRPSWRRAYRARALEPFTLAEVERVRQLLLCAVESANRSNDRLASLELDPYRGAHLLRRDPTVGATFVATA